MNANIEGVIVKSPGVLVLACSGSEVEYGID